MHDFGKLVYLDVQKTGSTFVSKFLNEACILPLVKKEKHGRIDGADYDQDAYYFITIRHPVAQYSSLFRYGLDKRGGLFPRLKKRGMAHLYRPDRKSFNEWLKFIIDPSNASLLREGYPKFVDSYNIGFLTFRFLMMSLADPLRTLQEHRDSKDALSEVYARKITNQIIKQEHLTAGLRDLASNIKPEFFDKEKVERFFADTGLINASTLPDKLSSEIDDGVISELRNRERLLFDLYS